MPKVNQSHRRSEARRFSPPLALAVLVFVLAMLGPAAALSDPPANAFRHVHDADGRLKAAIDPEGDTALYSWDATGNLLSIDRHPSDDLSIIQLSPAKGEVGETIEIEGTGFSPTPESNTVKFNGTAATVTAASPWSLSVKVPAEATTGTVTVKTPEEGPVTSAQTFTVASSKPSISSLSPTVAAAGEEVTISGSNFDSSTSGNYVRFNDSIPELTSAGEGSIKFKVPWARLGGKVSVSTFGGLSAGPDLFVPPTGVTAAKVGTTERFSMGSSKSVGFVGSEKVALLLFDGTAGKKASFVLSESTFSSGTASLWSPEGSQLATASFSKSGGMLDTATLPMTGTYTILLSPGGASTGSVKVTSHSVEDITGSIVPTEAGAKQSVSISVPGQVARYSVTVTAGQKIPVKTTSSNFSGTYEIDWLDPTGKVHADGGWWNGKEPDWFWNPVKFTSAGTYTLIVNPEGAATGSVDLTLWDASDITGQTITPSSGGGSTTSTVKVPGQQELITFSGTSGQRLLVALSEVKYGGTATIYTPSGSQVSGGWTSFSSGSSPLVGPLTLPATGTYTILVDPEGQQTGSVKLTAYTFEDVTGTIPTPTEEGVQQKAATSIPGQVARYSVTVTAGQKISLKTTESNFSGKYEIDWLDPSGKVHADGGWWNGKEADYFWNPVKFTSAGTYTLLVDPEGAHTGSVTVTLKDTPDITGQTITPSAEGGSATSTTKLPGQQELITFSGTSGQRLVLSSEEGTFEGQLRLLNPSGGQITSDTIGKGVKRMVGPLTLSSTGTHTIHIDPNGEQTGSVKLTAYTFEDVTGTIPTPTEEGVQQKVATSIPGQVARYSVTVAAGQKISLKTTESNFSGTYEIDWLDPSGKVHADGGWWNGKEADYFWNPVKFTNAGTYTLVVDPEGMHTGSVTVTLKDTPDITGQTITPSAEGGSATSTTKLPGQLELITFSGTSGQRLVLSSEESAFEGQLRLYNPSGGQVTSDTIGKGVKRMLGPLTLSSTGTYTIHIDPNGEQTGSVKLTAFIVEDITGSITPTEGGVKQKAATTIPGQAVRYSVKIAAGQKISLKTTESNFSGKYEIDWLDPSGKLYADGGWWSGKEADWFWKPTTFTNAGTYTLLVDPEGSGTGSVMLTLWDCPDLTGQTITPSTEGGSVTSTIKAAGQRELITFSGNASQLITLKAQESSIASGTMSILKPDGSLLSGSEFSFSSGSSAKREVTLPTTGTYTAIVDPTSDNVGSVKTIVYLGSHVSWMMPSAGTAQLVSFATDAPSVGPIEVSYSDIPATASSKPLMASEDEAAEGQSRSTEDEASKASSQPSGKKEDLHLTPEHIARQEQGKAPISRPSESQRADAEASPSRLSSSSGSPASIQSEKGPLVSSGVRQWEPKQGSWFPPKGSEDRGWFAGQSASPWLGIPPLQPAIETTALSGQALEVGGLPLAGMRVSIEGTQVAAETDEAGRFLLGGAPAGKQVLLIDGESVPGKRYGTYEVAVELKEGETTELDYTIWLTPLDEAGDLHVASPTEHEASLKTPRIPGLEVKIPAGTTITDAAGREVTDLNITAIPVDRAPFPLPPFVAVPVYFTVQPGRAYLSKGARFVYPNWAGLAPGQRVDFWNYDPEDRGWYVYGRGTVTPDGEQVAPDPGVRVWEFSGAMATSGSTPPPYGPNCHQNGAGTWQDEDGDLCGPSATGGDPVDLYTGLFTYEKTDLVLPDEIPITIERTYRPNDSNSYSFGIGTTSFYDLRLWPINNYKEAVLVLPDGGLVDYERTSPGTGYTEAVYEPTSSAGMFEGSTITYNQSIPAWELETTSGITFTFGWFTPLMAIHDRHGNRLTIKRTSGYYGDITQITSPHGRWARFTYDKEGRVTEIVDNGGRKVKYAYTSGRLTKVEGPTGRTTEYEYDGSGRMKAIVNARGNKYLTNAYDANGRVETQTTGDGATFGFEYELDKEGKVEATTITDPRGNKRVVEFDADGFPVSETEAPGTEVEQARSFERQPGTGLILSETDPLGRETEFEYDSNGNVTEITKLAGTEDAVTTKLKYEPGTTNVTEVTDPLGHSTELEYGPKGELTARIDALENETTLEYNGNGQPISITNPEEEETTLGYDHGDLASMTDPLGRTTSQFTDALGRVRSITQPGGQRTTFAYNDADELTSITSPSGAETAIGYDKDGDMISIIDPRENETTTEYDAMDRPIAETNPLEDTAKWDYDKAGNLIEAVSRDGVVSEFDYDELGRLAKASFGVSGESAESTIEYEYDDADRIIGVDDSAAGEYVLGYDELDRLTEVAGPQGTIAYVYDDAGRRELMLAPGMEAVSYEYDDADRLTEIASGAQVVSLGYDKASRLESLVLPNGIEQLYDYDKAGQLGSISYKDGESTLGALEYAFDQNGATEAVWGSYARLDLPKALKSATYNAANQLVEREEAKLSYDADGNLIDDGANEYEWDARGQLSAIKGAAKASFAYDPFGRRVSKTLGETTTELLHDGANVILESPEEETAVALLTGLIPDQILSRTGEEGTESYLTDRLGSVIALADSSAEDTTTYSYEPFGVASSAGEPSGNPFQFTGRENDGTGLQYNRARYYSPSAARFISQDPAGFAGSGANLYWYANGNPLDFTDPSGECFPCMPDFDPFGPVRDVVNDAIDEIGDWPSEAPGVASDLIDFADVSLTKAELLRAAAGEALGAALCAFATRVTMSTPDPRWKAAAAATCLSQRYAGATELGIQAADDD